MGQGNNKNKTNLFSSLLTQLTGHLAYALSDIFACALLSMPFEFDSPSFFDITLNRQEYQFNLVFQNNCSCCQHINMHLDRFFNSYYKLKLETTNLDLPHKLNL